MATKKKEFAGGKESRWANEGLKVFVTVLVKPMLLDPVSLDRKAAKKIRLMRLVFTWASRIIRLSR